MTSCKTFEYDGCIDIVKMLEQQLLSDGCHWLQMASSFCFIAWAQLLASVVLLSAYMGLNFVGEVKGLLLGWHGLVTTSGCVHGIIASFIATIVTLTYYLRPVHQERL